MSIISKIDLHTQGDPFEVTVGGSDNPGSLQVENPNTHPPLSSDDEGVYTCEIADETGERNSLHVGLYLSGFSGEQACCLINVVSAVIL